MQKRSYYFVFILMLVFSFVLIGCGGSKSYPPEVVEAGKVDFEATCSACHGPDAKGLPDLGKDLTTSEFVSDNSDEELLDMIKTGRPMGHELNTTGIDMPPKGGNPALTDDDILAIVAFVRIEKQTQFPVWVDEIGGDVCIATIFLND